MNSAALKPFQSKLAKTIAQSLLSGCIVACIAIAFAKLISRLEATPQWFSQPFILGIAIALIYRVVNAYGWAVILNAMGSNVDAKAATKIWLIGESRRWLPGGVWGYASRAAMAGKIGVSSAKASASMFLELLILLAAAVIVSVPGVALHWNDIAHATGRIIQGTQNSLALGAILLLCLLLPIFSKRLSNKIGTLASRYQGLKGMKLARLGMLKSVSFFVLMGTLNGLATGCLLKSIPGATEVPLSIVIAASSIAWVVGFLAIFSPGGLIIREATFAMLLAPWLPYPTGFAVAILARLVQIIAELSCLFAIFAYELWARKIANSPLQPTEQATLERLP